MAAVSQKSSFMNSSRRHNCIYGSNLEFLTFVYTAVKDGISGSKGIILVHRSNFDRNVQGWRDEKRPFIWATVAVQKPPTIAILNIYTKTVKREQLTEMDTEQISPDYVKGCHPFDGV